MERDSGYKSHGDSSRLPHIWASYARKENGRIINIASLASFVSLLEVAAYSASKAGVASLTKSLAVEWGNKGICVNAIAPGVFRTELNSTLLDGTNADVSFYCGRR